MVDRHGASKKAWVEWRPSSGSQVSTDRDHMQHRRFTLEAPNTKSSRVWLHRTIGLHRHLGQTSAATPCSAAGGGDRGRGIGSGGPFRRLSASDEAVSASSPELQ